MSERRQYVGRPRRLVLPLVFAIVAAAVPLSHALANYFGSTQPCGGTPRNCVSVGNDRTHYVLKFDLTSNISLAVSNALFNVYDAKTRIIGRTTTSSANADVIAADSNYGFNGVAGWVDCPASSPQGGANPDHWCLQQWMRFNSAYTPYFDDTASRNSTACHELGHTLGLNHDPATSGSCMTVNTPNGSQTIDAHDVAHIDGYWRYQ